MFRDGKGGYKTIHDLLDFDSLMPKLEKIKKLKDEGKTKKAMAYVSTIFPDIFRFKNLPLIFNSAFIFAMSRLGNPLKLNEHK